MWSSSSIHDDFMWPWDEPQKFVCTPQHKKEEEDEYNNLLSKIANNVSKLPHQPFPSLWDDEFIFQETWTYNPLLCEQQPAFSTFYIQMPCPQTQHVLKMPPLFNPFEYSASNHPFVCGNNEHHNKKNNNITLRTCEPLLTHEPNKILTREPHKRLPTNITPIINEKNIPLPLCCGIGLYSREVRAAKIMRYREKRTRRDFSKRVRYKCRKILSDIRPRRHGRFIKSENKVVKKTNMYKRRGRPRNPENRDTSPEKLIAWFV